VDDKPTIEAASEGSSVERPSTSDPRSAEFPPRRRQYRSRSERRTYRRAARRRKTMTRLGLFVGPTLVVIAVVVALLTLLGGPDTDGGVTTTLPADAVDDGIGRNALLVVEQGDTVPVMVLLHPRETGGVALAMPGLTLLKTPEGFKTLSELHLSDKDEALQTALAEAFGVRSEPVASVQWSDLRGAMEVAGVDELPLVTLAAGEGEAEQIASAVLGLVGASASGAGATAWAELPLGGEPDEFREAAGLIAAAVSAGGWSAVGLSGKLVETTGFEYLEPDVDAAKAVLAGTAQVLDMTLQVQNGSGVVGIAQEAGEVLASLGHTMLPPGNSEDFPDVARTRIEVAPDAVEQGKRVRALLGVGTIQTDATLESGHVIVVLGKDYVPPSATDAEPAG
jgi:hypothetical protein